MAAPRFRTQVACRIAGINRDRFNEAVAAGHYPCAPEVDRGATRVFDEDQLVSLFYYGRLLEWGLSPAVAGPIVCKFYGALAQHPDEKEVILTFQQNGLRRAVPGSAAARASEDTAEGADLRAALFYTPVAEGAGAFFVFQRLIVDVKNLRAIVRREIAEEISVLGPDDEGDAEEIDAAVERFRRTLLGEDGAQ
jgi:hypothetical protein